MSTEKAKISKDTAKSVSKVSKVPQRNKVVEQKYFAKQLAEKIGVDEFEFLIIQRKAGIDDSTPLTISEMKELYHKYIE